MKRRSNWKEQLAATIAESFFGAIWEGSLIVEIETGPRIAKSNIAEFLNDPSVARSITDLTDEPSRFNLAGAYLLSLMDGNGVRTIETEQTHLGHCELKLLVLEGLPKRICALRSGISITDELPNLKRLGEFKDFVAVVQCKSKKGNALLRDMEPPSHDKFEPGRLPSDEERKKGKKALDDLGKWIREMLKKHARDEVTDVTSVEELRDLFGEEGVDEAGEGANEINPFSNARVQLRPFKRRTIAMSKPTSWNEADGEWTHDGDGETIEDDVRDYPTDDKPNSDPTNDPPNPSPGPGKSGVAPSQNRPAQLENLRAVALSTHGRRVTFTPRQEGQIRIEFKAAGADADYPLPVVASDKGAVANGGVIISVCAGERVSLQLDFDENVAGAIKVVAYEI